MAGIPTQELFDNLVSFCLKTGHFDAVNTVEPPSPPGNSITAAIWVNAIKPTPQSGLNTVSVTVEFNIRVYPPNVMPSDQIDPNVMIITSDLYAELIANFDVGGIARNIDIFGAEGSSMSANAAYLALPGGPVYRVMTILLPIVINDVWEESEGD